MILLNLEPPFRKSWLRPWLYMYYIVICSKVAVSGFVWDWLILWTDQNCCLHYIQTKARLLICKPPDLWSHKTIFALWSYCGITNLIELCYSLAYSVWLVYKCIFGTLVYSYISENLMVKGLIHGKLVHAATITIT